MFIDIKIYVIILLYKTNNVLDLFSHLNSFWVWICDIRIIYYLMCKHFNTNSLAQRVYECESTYFNLTKNARKLE